MHDDQDERLHHHGSQLVSSQPDAVLIMVSSYCLPVAPPPCSGARRPRRQTCRPAWGRGACRAGGPHSQAGSARHKSVCQPVMALASTSCLPHVRGLGPAPTPVIGELMPPSEGLCGSAGYRLTCTSPGILSSFWGARISRAEAKSSTWAQPAGGTAATALRPEEDQQAPAGSSTGAGVKSEPGV